MRIDAIVSPSGEVIKLTDEEQIDLVLCFSFAIFRSVFFTGPGAPSLPKPPPSVTPSEAFGGLLAAYIAANLDEVRSNRKESGNEQPLRH